MTAPDEQRLLVSRDGGVLRLTLNRPDAANAIATEQRDALIAALRGASADPGVRVVVLAANGRHFCSGADVAGLGAPKGGRRVGDGMRRIMGGAQQLIAAVLDCDKPVVAAVQGAAAGMGAHLAYAADLVVATESATFIEAFVLRGLVVDAGGAYLLPRLIGLQRAKELAFFGEKITAAQAFSLGLVNRVVPPADLDATVTDFTDRLVAAPTSAVSFTKRLFNTSFDQNRDAAFLAEAMSQDMQSASHDAAEGVLAFREKRPPQYTGT